eukprot:CAMPEP_0174342592 /NCGR_PEP_ID=MMETSP0810-20121108/26294_1 /TAXON_ID=73025 ORGANISM="Eutreptiella gymnastica-like, Strain CCMP1594" /NCGR_SAMPLE_ID=MMETSP0810 /ASSEMBLY_ACC=CAM_ASM_000659 /LENGTH=205 /DNA_ID=CAMNT_0015464839 /DNA_START=469 /DNA_END=1086 /DNA_ORIENTATION=+
MGWWNLHASIFLIWDENDNSIVGIHVVLASRWAGGGKGDPGMLRSSFDVGNGLWFRRHTAGDIDNTEGVVTAHVILIPVFRIEGGQRFSSLLHHYFDSSLQGRPFVREFGNALFLILAQRAIQQEERMAVQDAPQALVHFVPIQPFRITLRSGNDLASLWQRVALLFLLRQNHKFVFAGSRWRLAALVALLAAVLAVACRAAIII